MSEGSSRIDAARRLLAEGASVGAVLASFEAQGLTGTLSMIKALREVVPLGLSHAAVIVDRYRSGEAQIGKLGEARLLLLTHPGVRAGWEGEGPQIYRFFQAAVMEDREALTVVPSGQSQYGNSFHFWWRLSPGSEEHDPLFGSISGSQATILSLGEALQRVVSADAVLAKHTEVLEVSGERVSCRFSLPPGALAGR
jgi:hypothetical protein